MENLLKIWDVLLIEHIHIIFLFISFILKENKSYIMLSSKETIMRDFNEISDFASIDGLIADVLKIYRFIPQSLIPFNHEFKEEELIELKNNEYFKNRWWEFENFNTEVINVPVISMDDCIKVYDKIIFVDIRLQQEYDNIRVKDSLLFKNSRGKINDACVNAVEKSNGTKIVVIIGNRNSDYKEPIQTLMFKKIKMITILQGGIDVVYTDEPSLIYTK